MILFFSKFCILYEDFQKWPIIVIAVNKHLLYNVEVSNIQKQHSLQTQDAIIKLL